MNRRRWVIKVVGLLLIGAVINVAVAWGLAGMPIANGRHHPEQLGVYLSSGTSPSWEFAYVSLPGAVRFISAPCNPQSLRAMDSVVRPEVIATWTTLRDLLGKSALDLTMDAVADDARGWPALSMRCKYLLESRRGDLFAVDVEGGIAIQGVHTMGLPPLTPGIPLRADCLFAKALPLWPIWPGFAINTLFYAAVVWLLLAVPTTIRRRRRLRRGLCPTCAYPIGASAVCTECGRTLGHRRINRI